MNGIAILHLKIGIIKDLKEKGIITEDEMKLAIIEAKKKSEEEEDEL